MSIGLNTMANNNAQYGIDMINANIRKYAGIIIGGEYFGDFFEGDSVVSNYLEVVPNKYVIIARKSTRLWHT
jgi:hypothetical protein